MADMEGCGRGSITNQRGEHPHEACSLVWRARTGLR